MSIRKELEAEKSKVEQTIKEIQNHSFWSKRGNLRCTTCKKHHQYYIDGKYVKKSGMAEATELAQRDYEKKLLPCLSSLYEQLKNLSDIYDSDELVNAFSNMCEGKRNLVKPYFIDKEMAVEQWLAQEYEHWEITDQTKGIFFTEQGVQVRSKSEKIIADELSRFHVPYRYEFPLEVYNGNNRKILRPDFMVLNRRTLKEYIVEHLGMMDKFDYYNRTMSKIDLYERNGYLIGKNLILLHETSDSPLNMTVLDNYIKEFLI